MDAPTFTKQQLNNWRAYERVRAGGRYNMFTNAAQRMAGLNRDEFFFVMDNYSALKEAAERNQDGSTD